VEKPIDEFPYLTKRNRHLSKCRECKRSYDRRYWSGTKELRLARKQSNFAKLRMRNTEYILNILKTNPCASCGESDPIVLDFDHLDPSTKIENVSNLVGSGCSLRRIKEEVKKCQILCANCHRRKTARERGYIRISAL